MTEKLNGIAIDENEKSIANFKKEMKEREKNGFEENTVRKKKVK